MRQLREQLAPLLRGRQASSMSVLVDLAGVHHIDCRALPALHELQRQVHDAGGRFAVRRLDPAALTGFDRAGLPEMPSIHLASLALGPPRRRLLEVVAGKVNDVDLRLARACRSLVSADRESPAAAADELVTQRRDLLGLSAAVVLAVSVGCGAEVTVIAGAEDARLAAGAGLLPQQGPVVECLHLAEPVQSTDLALDAGTWPRYVDAVLCDDVRAVWALPVRLPRASRSPHAPTCLGALVLVSVLPAPLAPADLGLAQVMAELTAVAIERTPWWLPSGRTPRIDRPARQR